MSIMLRNPTHIHNHRMYRKLYPKWQKGYISIKTLLKYYDGTILLDWQAEALEKEKGADC